MNANDILKELEAMGTAQNVKVYKRHGAGDNLYGVSFANLAKLKKKIKVDHDLAVALWESGNSDARTLAAMIADPKRLKISEADRWIGEVSYYVLSDSVAGLAAKSSHAEKLMMKWMKSKKEFVRAAGYNILASILKNGSDIPDKELREILKRIEKEIGDSPNRARHSMNNAIIAIGVYRPVLSGEAIETARRIGEVEVDHGETSCKTPDAESYIRKSLKRPKAKA